MAGRRDFSNISAASLKKQAAELTLRKARKEGHVYVNIMQDGKTLIFFCVLCHAPCYSDNTLYAHLGGKYHRRRLATAKVTLLLPNPWPFSDGVFFFHTNTTNKNDMNPPVVDTTVNGSSGSSDLVIPGVLRGDEKCSLQVKLIGLGEIGARFHAKNQNDEDISRIWCAWLGKVGLHGEDGIPMLQEHDFGIVTFSYNFNLGREPVVRSLDQLYAFRKETRQSKSERKRIRKEMREQLSIAAERQCDICNIKLHPGKDAASLLNMKTGRFACSSRNLTGAFHVFHASCLLHWILICEYEIWTNRSNQEVPQQSKRKGRTRTKKNSKQDVKQNVPVKHISSIFCPECQGTGVDIEGEQLEKPSFQLLEMCNYKLKSKIAQKEWRKYPEALPNCSVGLHFPRQIKEPDEGTVASLKLLRFYRAGV